MKATLLSGIPLLIMTAIGIALIAQGKSADGRSTLAVGVIIAAVAGSSVIYQIGGWDLRRQSLAHFAIMLVTVLPALLLSGWFPLDSISGYFVVIAAFLAAGLVLWISFYLIFTKVVPRKADSSDAVRMP
ncbi:hypothetical protein FM104_09210 [Microbacterium esteraromaticum]|uniref:DUF3021 domain-containing protein n=1 Tax=Microbacterium esteraromaticum TaxID=57043 RepID=A0A1R4JWJ5_9MICO|nr:hypothetical protein FM104_09210 [Microbacterium esteraromaticum]